jgi:hypothetical protein
MIIQRRSEPLDLKALAAFSYRQSVGVDSLPEIELALMFTNNLQWRVW